MRRIVTFLFIIFISGCGFKPLYLNKSQNDFMYSEITSKGNETINKVIINRLQIRKDKSNQQKNKFHIESSLITKIASKNSKGQATSYGMELYVEIKTINKDEFTKKKQFVERFLYNNKENKFELVQYQNKIQNNLINKIIEDIIIYLNIK